MPELSVGEQAVLHTSLKSLCKKHLNPHLMWQEQTEEADALRSEARKECPFLARYEDAWPIRFVVYHMLSGWRSKLKRRSRTSTRAEKNSNGTQARSKRPARARKPRYAETRKSSVEEESASEATSTRQDGKAVGSSTHRSANMEVDQPAKDRVNGDQAEDNVHMHELMYPGVDGAAAHQNAGNATAGPSSSGNIRQAMGTAQARPGLPAADASSSLSSLSASGASTPIASGSRLPALNIDARAPRRAGTFSPVTASSSTVSPQPGSPVLQAIRVAAPDPAAAASRAVGATAARPAPYPDVPRRQPAQPYVLGFLRGVDPQLAAPDVMRRFVDAGIVQRADLLACARLPEHDLLAMLRADLGLDTLRSRMVRAALQRL